jgi:polyisoprenoid-binding protein YceI
MKTRQLLTLLITLIFIQSNYLNAQPSKVKDYKVTVKGTSTLHEWESAVEKLECKTSYKIEDNELIDIKDAILKISVESIKSTKGKVMDNKTHDAFHSEKFPFIIFTLRSEKINTLTSTVDLKGTLEMAGTTNPVNLVASYKILPGGDLQITGNKKVRMTEFNMEPPKAMMGTIKAGDEVTISFNIIFSGSNSIL